MRSRSLADRLSGIGRSGVVRSSGISAGFSEISAAAGHSRAFTVTPSAVFFFIIGGPVPPDVSRQKECFLCVMLWFGFKSKI